jgi:hypothetical protein
MFTKFYQYPKTNIINLHYPPKQGQIILQLLLQKWGVIH